MRLVYAHFPINAIPNDDGSAVQIRNFRKFPSLGRLRCWLLRVPHTKPSSSHALFLALQFHND